MKDGPSWAPRLSDVGAIALGAFIGFFLGRWSAAEVPVAPARVPSEVRFTGPPENPRLAAKKVPGGTIYFVEGQPGLVFVPEGPK